MIETNMLLDEMIQAKPTVNLIRAFYKANKYKSDCLKRIQQIIFNSNSPNIIYEYCKIFNEAMEEEDTINNIQTFFSYLSLKRSFFQEEEKLNLIIQNIFSKYLKFLILKKQQVNEKELYLLLVRLLSK